GLLPSTGPAAAKNGQIDIKNTSNKRKEPVCKGQKGPRWPSTGDRTGKDRKEGRLKRRKRRGRNRERKDPSRGFRRMGRRSGGASEIPVSLLFDATLDVLSSVIVLWRYSNAAAVHSAHREYMFSKNIPLTEVISQHLLSVCLSVRLSICRACVILGVVFVLSSLCILGKAIHDLATRVPPEVNRLFNRSLPQTVSGFNSMVGSIMGFSILISAEVFKHHTDVWFLDGTMGVVIGLIILAYGIKLLKDMVPRVRQTRNYERFDSVHLTLCVSWSPSGSLPLIPPLLPFSCPSPPVPCLSPPLSAPSLFRLLASFILSPLFISSPPPIVLLPLSRRFLTIVVNLVSPPLSSCLLSLGFFYCLVPFCSFSRSFLHLLLSSPPSPPPFVPSLAPSFSVPLLFPPSWSLSFSFLVPSLVFPWLPVLAPSIFVPGALLSLLPCVLVPLVLLLPCAPIPGSPLSRSTADPALSGGGVEELERLEYTLHRASVDQSSGVGADQSPGVCVDEPSGDGTDQPPSPPQQLERISYQDPAQTSSQ
ncbi:hypothetical protein FQN60_009317, partial [Etheostoma spectabile]